MILCSKKVYVYICHERHCRKHGCGINNIISSHRKKRTTEGSYRIYATPQTRVHIHTHYTYTHTICIGTLHTYMHTLYTNHIHTHYTLQAIDHDVSKQTRALPPGPWLNNTTCHLCSKVLFAQLSIFLFLGMEVKFLHMQGSCSTKLVVLAPSWVILGRDSTTETYSRPLTGGF